MAKLPSHLFSEDSSKEITKEDFDKITKELTKELKKVKSSGGQGNELFLLSNAAKKFFAAFGSASTFAKESSLDQSQSRVF